MDNIIAQPNRKLTRHIVVSREAGGVLAAASGSPAGCEGDPSAASPAAFLRGFPTSQPSATVRFNQTYAKCYYSRKKLINPKTLKP